MHAVQDYGEGVVRDLEEMDAMEVSAEEASGALADRCKDDIFHYEQTEDGKGRSVEKMFFHRV